jgi:polyhydroxyalkanoate synthesis regulator phasin
MANATLKREDGKSPYAQGVYLASQNRTNDEDLLDSFQSLEADETRLNEQKEHLTILLSQLETRAKEEFEKRKQNVERLNSEVSDLKRRCEKFASWVSSESALES